MNRCERMKLQLSCQLVFVYVLSSWSVSSPDACVVTQSPDVSAMEGDTVNITCCWMGEFEKIRVYWLKNQTNIKHEVFHLENHSQGSLLKKTSACSKLTIAYITRNDSGRYTCKVSVEIPLFCESEGKGTVITVVDRDYTDNITDPPIPDGTHWGELILVLRCLPILALVISFLWVYKLRIRVQHHTAAAPGNELLSARRLEDQEQEEGDEREAE